MRRIIFVVFFLELITIFECRSLLHKCSTSVGNFAIFVCTNRTEIRCSLRGITIPINTLTTQERKCIETVDHLGQNSITCTQSQRCHSDDRVAHYISTCAVLAVKEITPMFPQFATLCCRIQQTLIDLYYAVEKEVFKSLLTPITIGSLHSVSVNLKEIQWCREFHFKCRKIVTDLEVGCEHLGNRRRRNLENISPSNNTSKQTNSTSFTGRADEVSTSLSLTRTQKPETTAPQQIALASLSLVTSYRNVFTTTPSLPRTLSESTTLKSKMESRTHSSNIVTQSMATFYRKSVRRVSTVQRISLAFNHQTTSGISLAITRNTGIMSRRMKQSVSPTPHLPGTSPVSIPIPFSKESSKERSSTWPQMSAMSFVMPSSIKGYINKRPSTLNVAISAHSKSIIVTSTQTLPGKSISSISSKITKQQSLWELTKTSLSLSSRTSPLTLLLPSTPSVSLPQVPTVQLLSSTLTSSPSATSPQVPTPALRPLPSTSSSSASSPQAPTPTLRPLPSTPRTTLSQVSFKPMLTDLSSNTHISGTPTISPKDLKSSFDSFRSGSESTLTKQISPSVTQLSLTRSTTYQSVDLNDSSVNVLTIKASSSSSTKPLSIVQTALNSIDDKVNKPIQSAQRTLSMSSSVYDVPIGSMIATTLKLNSTNAPVSTVQIAPSSLSGRLSLLSLSLSSSLSSCSLSASFSNSSAPLLVTRSMTSSIPSQFSTTSSSSLTLASLTSLVQLPLLSSSPSLSSLSLIPSSLPQSSSVSKNNTVLPLPSLISPSFTATIQSSLKTNLQTSSTTITPILMPSPSSLDDTSILSERTETPLVKETTQPLSFTSKDTFSMNSTILESLTSSSTPRNISQSMHENQSKTLHLNKEITTSVPSKNVTETLVTVMMNSTILESLSSSPTPRNISQSIYENQSKTLHLNKEMTSSVPSKNVTETLATAPLTLTLSSLESSSSINYLEGSSAVLTASPSSISANVSLVSSVETETISLSSTTPTMESLRSLSAVITEKSMVSSQATSYFMKPSHATSYVMKPSISHLFLSPSPSLPTSPSSSPPSSFSSSNVSSLVQLSLPKVSSYLQSPESLTSPLVSSAPLSMTTSSTPPLLASKATLVSRSSIKMKLTSWSGNSSTIPASFFGTSSLLPSSINSSSKSISSKTLSPMSSSAFSLQRPSASTGGVPSSLSTASIPSAISTITSSLFPQEVITTSKLYSLVKPTTKLHHLFRSSVVGHSILSTVESGQTSRYRLISSKLKTRTADTNSTVVPKVYVNSTESILVPSKTLTVTAIPSVILNYIQTFLITFDGICPSSNKQEAFKIAFTRTIRRLIAIESSLIDIHSIQCGSVKVIFSIKCEQFSKIPEILEGLVRDEQFQVRLNGTIFKALNITIVEVTTHPSLSKTTPTDNPSVYAKIDNGKRVIMIIFVLFSATFGALALFGTVICIAKACGRRQFGKLRLNSSTLSTRGTNQIYKNELELVRLSPLHHGADYYGGHVIQRRDDSDDDEKIDNRTALLNRLRNDEVASRRGKIIVKDDDSYSSIAFY